MSQGNFCSSCGSAVELADVFCSKCGITLSGEVKRSQTRIETRVYQERNPLLDTSFFGVYLEGRTYLNLLYLILLLPLGIFYFTYTVTCFSTFVGLIPIVVGIFLLFFFLISLPYIMYAQTWLSQFLVGEKSKPDGVKFPAEGTKTQKGIQALKTTSIWKTFFYQLILAMPLGIITFTLTVTLLSTSLGLMFSWVNLIVEYFLTGAVFIGWHSSVLSTGFWTAIYIIAPVVGFFLLTLTLNITNRMAIYHSKMIRNIVSN